MRTDLEKPGLAVASKGMLRTWGQLRWLRDVEREERELGKWREDSRTTWLKGVQADYTGNCNCDGVCGKFWGTPLFPSSTYFCSVIPSLLPPSTHRPTLLQLPSLFPSTQYAPTARLLLQAHLQTGRGQSFARKLD